MGSHQEKLSLLQDLIALSKVDGNVSFMENNFIYTIALNLNISEIELNQLKNNPVDYSPENKETDRIIQFYRLLLLMSVDQVKEKEEIDFCKEAGLKMGLNPIAIDTTIQKILKSDTGMMSPNDVIKIFQPYHN
ncbi:MAG: hypothetical protein JKX68_02030 [Flavobacteriales bacterium]|nr:hypothetical protein [Flavobacteriales bacterium]